MEALSDFFKCHEASEINKESVKEIFNSLNEANTDHYTPLHYVADNSYPTNKAVALIKTLLELGVDPNKKEGNGGYSFIHLALYSEYSLDFFKEVLPIALDYSFDVNIKDEDGDSIIHTAIYSEDYFGEVCPFFELLGANFNIKTTNKEGKSIINALEDSITEAKKNSKKEWLDRLLKEEKAIISLLEEERRKYQAFLEDFKEKMENCSSLTTVNELLEMVNMIKENNLQEEIRTKLTTKKNSIEESIITIKNLWSELTALASIYPDNEALKTKIEEIKNQNTNHEININNINSVIDDIKNTINSVLDNFIKETAQNIKKASSYLENFQATSKEELLETMGNINEAFTFIGQISSITNRPITEEVKVLIKTN